MFDSRFLSYFIDYSRQFDSIESMNKNKSKETTMKQKNEPADPCREALEAFDHVGELLCRRRRGGTPCGVCLRCVAQAALATPNPLPALVEALEKIAYEPLSVGPEASAKDCLDDAVKIARAALAKAPKGEA